MRGLYGLLVGLFLAAPCGAEGRWESYIRPSDYAAMESDTSSIWLASTDGGLLRFVRASRTFEFLHHEPGGLASNELTSLAFDGGGRLWVGTTGAGASVRERDGLSWRLVSRLDGLPSDSVTALAADGFNLWIGTRHGLAFWNGVGEGSVDAVWPNEDENSFTNDYIQSVLVVDTTVWVATRGGVYRNSTVRVGSWAPVNGGLPQLDVQALGTDGTRVFALVNGAVYQGGETGSWNDSGVAGAVVALAHKYGQLLAVATSGLFRWTGSGWIFMPHAIPPGEPPGPGNGRAAIGHDLSYWAANSFGLWHQVATPTIYWELFTPNLPVGGNLLNVLVDGDLVYVTTLGQGVSRFDGVTWTNWLPRPCDTLPPDSFRNPSYCFGGLVDRTGHKWLGCWTCALERLEDRGPTPVFDHYWPVSPPPLSTPPDSMAHTWSWSAALDSSGRIWIGGDTPLLGDLAPAGVDRYEPDGSHSGNWQPTNSALRSQQIRALTVDRDGTLWVGYAGKGVDSFVGDPTSVSTLIPSTSSSSDIFGLHAEGSVLWVMSTRAVERWSTTSRQMIGSALPLPGSPVAVGAVHPLDLDSRGYAWVGIEAGLLKLDPNGQVVATYTVDNSPLAGNQIRTVRVDRSRDAIWIATTTGLSRFEPYYVAPPPPSLPSLTVGIFPNPARLSGLGVSLHLKGNAALYEGDIFDLCGRRVRRFASTSGGVFWDGRDDDGQLVAPGLYFVRARSGGREANARVVLLR